MRTQTQSIRMKIATLVFSAVGILLVNANCHAFKVSVGGLSIGGGTEINLTPFVAPALSGNPIPIVTGTPISIPSCQPGPITGGPTLSGTSPIQALAPLAGLGGAVIDFAKNVFSLPGTANRNMDKLGDGADSIKKGVETLTVEAKNVAQTANGAAEHWGAVTQAVVRFLNHLVLPMQVLLWVMVALVSVKCINRLSSPAAKRA